MSRRLEDLEPLTQEKVRRLIAISAGLGMELFVVHTYRSDAEQDILYAQGRTTPGPKVTNAKGGYSWHGYHRAVDFAFEDVNGKPSWDDLSDDEINDWNLLGECGEKIGMEWGGSFGDYGHFQFRDGLSLAEARRLRGEI